MNELYLLEPTPEMEAAAMASRQEYLDCGEPHINGSCGFSHFSNYRQCLERVNNAHKRETPGLASLPPPIFPYAKVMIKSSEPFSCATN